ncbi:DNA alkylation repair protein [Enterococcus sp. LJL51]|uniref:DNA alkylation repair protein n=1 Tax=Enterococcus sp. LJL51 TaxID=3416656 RepID=UPI003CECF533
MADLLKNMYNQQSINGLAEDIQTVYPTFPIESFLSEVIDDAWADLELKARMRKISTSLGNYLPSDYEEALTVLDKVVANYSGFFGILFPDFVEVYGQSDTDWALSVAALERYTVYSSSEFAVRPFIIKDSERMMKQMRSWSQSENEHIRRLASEGCRPQLPWGVALSAYKIDPSPVLPILEQLKTDPSLYVRKSVANNLNDISKTHPELVMELAREWYGENEQTNWILKHGCRTLLKRGNQEVLAVFGYHDASAIIIEDFSLANDVISKGEELSFSVALSANEATKIRLEYGIDYVKANGKRNRKIFKISELSLKEGEQKLYSKTHSFADLTTRKHYPGQHTITLIVNGAERETLDFDLNG